MAITDFLKLSFLVSLLSAGKDYTPAPPLRAWPAAVFPPKCNRVECPRYDVVGAGDGYEIRCYNSTVWISTQPINDVSFYVGTTKAFYQLADYIHGKNDKQLKLEMTVPVITQVKNPPSGGASSFVVSYYVPEENQASPPSAEGLHLQKWGTTYVAVRQFEGFVKNSPEEAAALYGSLSGTVWGDVVEDDVMQYIVAQYNSPAELQNRVNEIWLTLELPEKKKKKMEIEYFDVM